MDSMTNELKPLSKFADRLLHLIEVNGGLRALSYRSGVGEEAVIHILAANGAAISYNGWLADLANRALTTELHERRKMRRGKAKTGEKQA